MKHLASDHAHSVTYLVERRGARRLPLIAAARPSLQEAIETAEQLGRDTHIHEMPFPADAASLAHALGHVRQWARDARGQWCSCAVSASRKA